MTLPSNKTISYHKRHHTRLVSSQETVDFSDTDSLKEKIRGVLRQIHKENEEGGMVKIDMWSHFGHAYITKIDEGENWGKRGRDDTLEEQ